MSDYIFPVTTILLLMLFYFGLPNLDLITEELIISKAAKRHITKADALVMAIITAVFAFVDFYALGNNKSPESFELMAGKTSVIELKANTPVKKIMLFSGVGVGKYIIEYYNSGDTWKTAAEFEQDYSKVLKWHAVEPWQNVTSLFFRISADNTAYLGEIAFLDEYNKPIPFFTETTAISDEQDVISSEESYLNSTYFDEIYHARTAWEHLNNIYPYEISHPPLGKLIIAFFISIFGMTPFGWRFAGTFFGVLMLPLMYVFLKKLFCSTTVSAAATLVFASDFMRFVQTRIATIDTYGVFFILLMYLFMYEYILSGKNTYLGLCGISFGLGAASKWTCIYAGAGLALIWILYRISKRKEGLKAFIKNSLFCLIFFIFIPCIIYYVSYIPYGRALGIRGIFNSQYLKTVLENQEFMFNYHSKLVAEHPYSSKWYQWVFDIRPILYYLSYLPDGKRSSFGAFVNPVLCWGGIVAELAILYRTIIHKDKIAAFLLIAYSAQLIPWVFITRLTFEYHYFPCAAFLVLAMGYIFYIMKRFSKHGDVFIWCFTAVSLALFILFYPALSGMPVDNKTATALLGWLPSWPF